jgi:NhaA family Na+:H+ antiporter
MLKESAVLRRFAALLDFLRSETAGGLILILSAVVALIWANSSAGSSYQALLRFRLGPQTVHVWVNDGLMAIFFLLVGLELRREMTRGELASLGRLAAPALAALGGMIVPAMVFSAFNYHDRFVMRGWAVPVATDIAFALAVLSVLGKRVPISLKVFLTALAIIDDLGAIIVIALFYTSDLDLTALGIACALLAGLWGLSRVGVRALWPYLVGGVVLWALVFESGVHSTLSGVALAFVVPMERHGAERAAPAIRLEHALDRWVAYAILPLFGLTNAGLRFDTLPPGAWRDTLAIGTALGLFIGKQIGVYCTVTLAARLHLARLPAGVTKAQLYGGSVLCGVGFTMSLFIGDLAFRQTPRGDEVKLAVFVGSLGSALVGLAILAFACRPARVNPPS